MNEPLKLVTMRDDIAITVHEKLLELVSIAKSENFTGMAVVLLRTDGGSYVSTIGRGNRVALLGAVADLQYTIAKDGDK